MKTVILGPGRVGCGFVGQVVAQAGHEVVFLARDPGLVAHLNRFGGYAVRLVDGRRSVEQWVSCGRAVDIADRSRAVAEISDADLVITAVGVRGLTEIAPLLAAGLAPRGRPATVLSFENAVDPAGIVRVAVRARFPIGEPAGRHSFASGLVLGIVSRRVGDPGAAHPLTFVGEPVRQAVVDGSALPAPLPPLPGVIVADRYVPWVRRKLYTLNAAHAAAAYLGALKGYRHVHAAVRDTEIRSVVVGVLRESHAGLVARYGAGFAGPVHDTVAVLARLANPGLSDLVGRAGADPLRKLAPGERFAGAAVLVEEAGIVPRSLALACAAAVHAVVSAGPATAGPAAIVRDVCCLDPTAGTGLLIEQLAQALRRRTDRGTPLIRLPVPALRPGRCRPVGRTAA